MAAAAPAAPSMWQSVSECKARCGCRLAVRTLRAFGLGGVERIFSEPQLRARALLHWTQWLFAGFGWGGVVYFQTMILAPDEPDPPLNATGAANGTAATACAFEYRSQLLVFSMEVPGTFLVQALVDKPRGPDGLLGGRRGCAVVGYLTVALAGSLMALKGSIGKAGVLACGCLARAALAASNAAIWIASPEHYPTHVRGIGVNVAYLMNTLGCVPASLWVYAPLPSWLIAAAVGAANLAAGAIAWALPETAGVSLSVVA